MLLTGNDKSLLNSGDLFTREGGNFTKSNLGFVGSSKSYDLDGDGMDDIVFYSPIRLAWVRNEGNGSFSSPIVISTLDGDYKPSGFVLKDMDNDGDVDIIINGYKREIDDFFSGGLIVGKVLPSADYEASQLILYENLGDVSFKERRPFIPIKGRGMLTWDPYGFVVEDIDNDGLQDVVIGANLYYGLLDAANYLYRQKSGLLSFEAPIEIPGRPLPTTSLRSLDLNRDGHMDIITTSANTILYTNDGDGVSFSEFYNFGYSIASVIDDLDGDGLDDLIYSRITKIRGEITGVDDTGRVYWNRGSLVYAPVVNTGEVVSNSSFRFSWDPGEYAEKYLVYVAKDPFF